jgi:hypothetical protein
MMLAHLLSSRPVHGRTAFVAVLVVLCFLLNLTPAVAAGTGEVSAGSGPAASVTLAFISDIMGSRTRMIQIACVVGAIGIFFLTRSLRN